MKSLVRGIGLLFVFMMTIVLCYGQETYEYTFDNSGNRIRREVIDLSSALLPGSYDGAIEKVDSTGNQVGIYDIKIYPNPTSGLLKIDFPSMRAEKDIFIRVVDSKGKLVIDYQAKTSDNMVNLSGYPSGFYIMKIRIDGVEKEWKVIKK